MLNWMYSEVTTFIVHLVSCKITVLKYTTTNPNQTWRVQVVTILSGIDEGCLVYPAYKKVFQEILSFLQTLFIIKFRIRRLFIRMHINRLRGRQLFVT